MTSVQELDKLNSSPNEIRTSKEADEYNVEEEKQFQCEQCPKRYNKKSSVYDHVRKVHSVYFFQCQECGKLFYHQKSLNDHLTTDHLKDFSECQEIFKCDKCGKYFTSSDSLNLHQKFICKPAIQAHYSTIQNDLKRNPDIVDVTPKETIEKKFEVRKVILKKVKRTKGKLCFRTDWCNLTKILYLRSCEIMYEIIGVMI